MITDSFDDKSEAIITPGAFYGEAGKVCDIAIATFSHEIYAEALRRCDNEQIAEIRMANRIRPVHLLPHVKGRVWTTDAIYRETRETVQRRKAEGCIAVEMEIAGVQAVCDYHGLELYAFIVTGDVVDQADYTPEGLHSANHSLDKFDIAMRIARKLQDDGK